MGREMGPWIRVVWFNEGREKRITEPREVLQSDVDE